MIALQPRLKPDVSTGRGEVPPARKAPKPLPEPERPGRERLLEPRAMTRRQRLTLPCTASDLKLQHEPFIHGARRASSTRHCPPTRRRIQERANSSDKDSRRAGLIGNGPTRVSRDSE